MFLFAFSIAGSAQPRMEVQDTVDWGLVVPDAPPGQTSKVSAEVEIKNVGDETLRISEVLPGCGCTTAPLDEMVLEAGRGTTMHVTLNLPLSNGRLVKRITIQSNDESAEARVVWLIADVQRPLQASSSFIPFDKGVVGQPIEGVISFKVFGKTPVSIEASPESEGIKIITPMPLTIEPNSSADLTVEYTPTEAGPFTVGVAVKTSLEGYSSFSFKGYGSADSSKP